MSNEQEVARIMRMSLWALLDYVLTNPEYICDSYYRVFGTAINRRFKQLTNDLQGN